MTCFDSVSHAPEQAPIISQENLSGSAEPLFPADIRPSSDRLDVAVLGRGLLKDGTFNHDLINTVVWSTIGGIPLLGAPLVTSLSDVTVCQSVFVTLGYSMKHTLVCGEPVATKQLALVRSQLCIVASLGRKYGGQGRDAWEDAVRSFDERFPPRALWEAGSRLIHRAGGCRNGNHNEGAMPGVARPPASKPAERVREAAESVT